MWPLNTIQIILDNVQAHLIEQGYVRSSTVLHSILYPNCSQEMWDLLSSYFPIWKSHSLLFWPWHSVIIIVHNYYHFFKAISAYSLGSVYIDASFVEHWNNSVSKHLLQRRLEYSFMTRASFSSVISQLSICCTLTMSWYYLLRHPVPSNDSVESMDEPAVYVNHRFVQRALEDHFSSTHMVPNWKETLKSCQNQHQSQWLALIQACPMTFRHLIG